MFTVNYDNKTYKVFFRYGKDKPHYSKLTKRYTECVLAEKLAEKEYQNVMSYKEYCSNLDNFDKNRGRKLALQNLLKILDLPKEVRVLFWEEYFKARGFKEKIVLVSIVGDYGAKEIEIVPVPNY